MERKLYMILNNDDFDEYDYLKPIHLKNKKILKKFDEICKENNWTYFLGYGTLLGAARHHDCIPWDDDIDVVMERRQYDQLIEYFCTNKIEGYFLSSVETDNMGNNLFAKFVCVDEESNQYPEYKTHPLGLSIDIFPLDDAVSTKEIRQIIKDKWIAYFRLVIGVKDRLESRRYKEPFLKKIKKQVFVLPFRFKTIKQLILYITKVCKKGNSSQKPNYVNYCTPYSAKKENTPKSYWYPVTELPLGDKCYPVPNKYEKILTQLYGLDWNQVPPEKKRYCHDEYNHNFWKKEE